MIVDDEDSPRQSLRIIFKDDYEVLMASDGPAAVELAQKHKVDVAVLDIRMAGMSGIEVLERLKYVNPAIEVVMMTAYESTETMRRALQLRACDYINKPFDVSTMRAAVAAAMQRRTLQSEILTGAEKLQQMVQELESQKMEEQMAKTRSDIYASIMHDINGPLAVVSGYVQLVSQRVDRGTRLELEDLEFIKERLKTITRHATNCIEISRRYLGFLQQRPDQAPEVGVNQLLTDLEQLLRVHPSRQNNELDLRLLPEDIAVRMNGTDFIQVIRNLAVNAFQCAAQAHSVAIESQLLVKGLDLAAIKDGPQDRLLNSEAFDNTPPVLVVVVRDNGPGIPAEILPKVFQASFSTKAPGQGTGLGLNIVLRLIKEAKGALHVHTQVGEGTRFSVYLPAVAIAPARPPERVVLR
jgi:two-component system, sensor histidine kinase and response regulator